MYKIKDLNGERAIWKFLWKGINFELFLEPDSRIRDKAKLCY